MWMNEWEVEDLQRRFDDDTPNLCNAAQILGRLVDWTNNNSDGWAYWQKPSNAASSLMDALRQKERDQREDGCVAREGKVVKFTDLTDAELKQVLRPIKAFLTRQKVEHNTILEPPPPPPPVRNWRQEFTNLFQAVAACEAPTGTQVDDVLGRFQATFDETRTTG